MAHLFTNQSSVDHRQTSDHEGFDPEYHCGYYHHCHHLSLGERSQLHPVNRPPSGAFPGVLNGIYSLYHPQSDDKSHVEGPVIQVTKLLLYNEDSNHECPASEEKVSDSKVEAQSETLERLMELRQPLDITGNISLDGCLPVICGGYAAVYRAKWEGIPVAVKVLNPHQQRREAVNWSATMTRRCKREISVMAAVSHRNIVRFCGFVNDIGKFPAIISEWCEHGSSADYLHKNRGRISEADRLTLAQDVVHGLAYLHSLGIIHGDLKPGNVLIDGDGTAKICDFGLARLVEWHGPSGMTTTSPYGGTTLYKAYELFKTKGKAHPLPSFASDIYALGCVIHEFLYFAPPFQHLETSLELFEALKEGKPPAQRPTNILDEANSLLWDLIEACWRVDPLRRPSAEDVVLRLNQIHTIRHQITNNASISSPGTSRKSRSAHQVGIGNTIGRSASSRLGSTDGSRPLTTGIPQRIRDQEDTRLTGTFPILSHVYRLFRTFFSAILQLVSSKI